MTQVPRRSALLRPRTAVNIILKADQPTGKLTHGTIADILTKGDHPRGVKVRLESGAVGRVQSLASSAAPDIAETAASGGNAGAVTDTGSTGAGNVKSRYRFQEDYRLNEPQPPSEVASLADYIKVPSRNSKKKNKRDGTGEHLQSRNTLPSSSARQVIEAESDGIGRQMSEQARLEAEFPAVDSALVAALLGDGSSLDEARAVLASIS